MKQSHTPGPWKTCHKESGNRYVADQAGKTCIAFAPVFNGSSAPDIVTAQANAALIAAAPDLLAALENAANVLAGIATGDLKTIGKDSPALVQARSAIAKAKGGA